MARKAREKSESGNYFVVLKGTELYASEADKERFAQIADEKFEDGKVYRIEFYENEIHMVVKEGEKGISAHMKSLTTVYARYYNNAAGRSGKLFEGRFYSEPLTHFYDEPRYITGAKQVSVPEKPRRQKSEEAPKTVKVTEKKPEVKEKPRKNLPSWLL